MRGCIFDSAPGSRSIISAMKAAAISFGGSSSIYRYCVALFIGFYLSIGSLWLYFVAFITSKPFQFAPLLLAEEESKWPQLFLYSKKDELIDYTVSLMIY